MANEKPEVVAQAQELATKMLLNIHLAELRERAALIQNELALATGGTYCLNPALRLDVEMSDGSHFGFAV